MAKILIFDFEELKVLFKTSLHKLDRANKCTVAIVI